MISKIAIFRALYLGDMLCIIPAVRAIRTAFPEAKIVLIGLPWQRNFVQRFSRYFNDFLQFPGWPGLPEQDPDVEKIINFLRDIRKEGLISSLTMQGNEDITNSMCMLWGGDKVCGLRTQKGYAPHPDLFPIALLFHARLLVSNDTGVSHIAAALHVPRVILFSPYSDINRWRPLDIMQHIATPWQRAEDLTYVMQAIDATPKRKAERRLVMPDA